MQLSRRYLLPGLGLLARADPADAPLDLFHRLLDPDAKSARAVAQELERLWRPGYAILLIEMQRVISQLAGPAPAPKAEAALGRLMDLLRRVTGQSFPRHSPEWNRWAWAQDAPLHPGYAEFKGQLYSNIDPRMKTFFPPDVVSTIRLDLIEWGGVTVNGIPPLVAPATVSASEARYLRDSHIVFGVDIEGQARAYPKRILAWHEMARDTVGGRELALVYCTLCGTVIPYFAESGGKKWTLGTSGLLYESSKLMFDEETHSLWPTLEGRPRVGTLARTGIQLEFAPVVTTTWGEWRARHPATTVLSLDTGHRRDYAEGAAYRDYFGVDSLMFEVSRHDSRLRNKDEVLVIRLPGKTPLAIAQKFLARHPEFAVEHQGVPLIIRTTAGGANYVTSEGRTVPAHRAFWFGWYAQFPDTVLVK